MTIVKPILQALVLAERVYALANGGKVIAGTFNTLTLPKSETPEAAPAIVAGGGIQGSPAAYLSLTNVGDGMELALQFVSLAHNKVLFETKIEITAGDPRATVEVIVELPSLKIPGPGDYAFEVVCEGEILGSSRLCATVCEK